MTKDEKLTVGLLIEGFSFGLTDREACLYANCGADWLYDYIKRNPKFSEQKEALKDNPKIKAKRIINESLEQNDKDIAKWYLERKAKNEFSTRQEVDLEGTVDNHFIVEFVNGTEDTVSE